MLQLLFTSFLQRCHHYLIKEINAIKFKEVTTYYPFRHKRITFPIKLSVRAYMYAYVLRMTLTKFHGLNRKLNDHVHFLFSSAIYTETKTTILTRVPYRSSCLIMA